MTKKTDDSEVTERDPKEEPAIEGEMGYGDPPAEVRGPSLMQVVSGAGSLEAAQAQAEAYVKLVNAIKRTAIKLTTERDWCAFENEPFLEHTGAKKIADGYGISIEWVEDKTEHHKDAKGEYILVEVWLKGHWRGRFVTDKGICSTRDRLLGRKGGEFKPLEDVDLPNVKLKAQSSAMRRVIKSLIGFDPTWDDLKEAGLDVDRIKSERGIQHRKGAQGGTSSNLDKGQVSERHTYWLKIIEFCGNDELNAKEWLEAKTTWTVLKGEDKGKEVPGKRDINSIKGKQWDWLKPKIEEQYQLYLKSVSGPEQEG